MTDEDRDFFAVAEALDEAATAMLMCDRPVSLADIDAALSVVIAATVDLERLRRTLEHRDA
jgi:hypothetical protein